MWTTAGRLERREEACKGNVHEDIAPLMCESPKRARLMIVRRCCHHLHGRPNVLKAWLGAKITTLQVYVYCYSLSRYNSKATLSFFILADTDQHA